MVRKRFDTAPKINVKDEGLLIQQATGSTANLLEIKDAAGNTLVSYSSAGIMTTPITPAFNGGISTTNINASGNVTSGNISTGNISASGNITVSGNLIVSGNTVTFDTETVVIEDKNIVLGNSIVASNITADGGGITLAAGASGNKTFNFVNFTSSWTSSEHLDLASNKVLKINGVQVLSATQYTGNSNTAGTVTSSSQSNITSLGTLTGLTVNGNVNVSSGGYQYNGNSIIPLRYADITGVAVTQTTTDFLLNLPSGVDYFNFVSITPISNFDNNIVWLFGWALGNWSGVQTTTQIRIRAALGNGVHLGTSTFRVYYRG